MKTPRGLNKSIKAKKFNFFTSLFLNSPVPKTISSISTNKYQSVNPAWEAFTGFTKKEVIGKTASQLDLISLSDEVFINKELILEKEVVSYKSFCRLKNGDVKEVLMSFYIISINNEAFILNTINTPEGLYSNKDHDEKALIKRTEELLVAQDFIVNSIENMTDGFLSLNSDWVYTYINKKAAKLLGKKPKYFIGKNIWEEFPEIVGKPFYDNYHKALKTQKIISFEDYYQPWDRWYENRVIPSKDGLSIFFRDITSRVKSRQELMSQKEYSENLIQALQHGLSVVNHEGEIMDVNPVFCEMIGYKREELIGLKAPFPYWAPESYQQLKVAFQQTLLGFVGEYEFVFKRKNGEHFPVHLKIAIQKDSTGATKMFFLTIDDITERKKTEGLLIKGKKYLDNIINNVGDPLFVKDNKSHLLLVNNAFCSVFNLSREDIIGKTLEGKVPQKERECFLSIDKEVLLTGVENINEEALMLTGTHARVFSTKKTRFIDDGGNKHIIGVMRDITERKQSEIDLKLSKEFEDKLIMSMQEGLIIVNLEGKIIQVNQSTCDILQYTKEELIGMELPYPFATIQDFAEIEKLNNQGVPGQSRSFKFEFIKKNGKKFWASFFTGSIRDDKGDVIAFFGTMKDISEELKLQNTLEDIAEKSIQKKSVILELAGLVGGDFEMALEKITALSAETLNVERVSVWSYNADKSELYCEKAYDAKNKSYTNKPVISENDNPTYFKALSKNKTISVFDAVKNEITKDFAEDYLIPNGIASLLDVFIERGVDNYGVICYEHVGKKRKWTAEEEEFASSIANLVSLMVESKERKLAEGKLIETNAKLLMVNEELNRLKKKLEEENVYLRQEIDLVFNYEEMVYSSAAFSNVLTDVERVAKTNATVLLLGESGTGKELLARAIHNISARKNKPLIKVNCAAIPKELIESELFGHKKGAFTGAISDKLGKFQLADGGTLFLDEIGELPIDMQPKLLRAIQESEIEQVGGIVTHKVDIRIIAATNRDLKKEVLNKNFREDLYFRINVFPIVVPPLRERVEDIPILIEHFVDKFSKIYNKNILYISEEAKQNLQAYKWPGNIRELENLIERAVILSDSETLIISPLGGSSSSSSSSSSRELPINMSGLTLDEVQRNHIIKTLDKCDWKIDGEQGASKLLDIKPSTLRDRMKKLGIKKPIKK